MNAQTRVTTALHDIRKRRPWIGATLQRLPITYADRTPHGQPVSTMATNGLDIFINPAFVETLTDSNLRGVLVHEALHVINRHALRRKWRDPHKFNIAADHAINGDVYKLGFTLPDDALTALNGSAELIYKQKFGDDKAEQPQPEQGDNSESDSDNGDGDQSEQGYGDQSGSDDNSESGSDNGDGDQSGEPGNGQAGGNPAGADDVDLFDYPLKPGETLADAERKIDRVISQARQDAAMAGEGPTSEELRAFEISETDLNWPKELEDYMLNIGGSDYSLNPPHIGLLNGGIIANALNPQGVGNVVIAVDTSGSINTGKLNLALTHLQLFAENIDYETLRVISCSTQIGFDETFTRGEPIDISGMPTGGGTAFTPVFDRVAEGQQPDLLIYFTDLQCYKYPEADPGYPVLWLVDGDASDYSGPQYGDRINATQ